MRASASPTSSFTNAPVGESVPSEPDRTAALPASTFKYVGHASWSHKAVEAYLKSHGHPPHSYVAELVMLMERYFLGKYLKGEREHYQQIMPSKRWKLGDSLSEKLTRCKDKETFNARFSRIGVTEVLRQGHFEDRQITNIDFRGKLYLRLIDTTRKNVSRFYRNDAAVEAFFDAAHDFYAKQLQSKRDRQKPVLWNRAKADVVGLQKPEVEDVENPNSLLSNRLPIVETNKQRLDVPHIHSSPEENTEIIRMPTCRKERPATESELTERSKGWQVFHLWRDALIAQDESLCISAQPTKAQLRNAELLRQRLEEFFPDAHLSRFLADATDHWGELQRWLKEAGVWQTLGAYPELAQLALYSDKVLTWYRRERNRSGEAIISEPETRKNTVSRPPSPQILPPHRGCKLVTAAGRTFRGGGPESLEYQIAAISRTPRPFWEDFVVMLEEQLKNDSIDLEASRARIRQLQQLSDEEFESELFCC